MSIQIAKKEDLPECSRVIERAIDNIPESFHPKNSISILRNSSNNYNLEKEVMKNQLIVYKNDDKVVGVGSIDEGYIDKVYIDPEFQGKGIGKAIVNSLEGKAMTNGASHVYLRSTRNALSFYSNLGYQLERENNTDKFKFMIKKL